MATEDTGPLAAELKYYEANRDEILRHHEGSFVLIGDGKLVGAFTTEAEAYEAGLSRFGNQPFLIKHATRDDSGTAQIPALSLSVIYDDTQQAI